MNKSKSIIFQCEDCGKVLSNENNLTKHKLSHNVDNKFICDKCGLSFVKSHLLALHSCTIKSEPKTKIRSCICQTCGKTFANSSNLNKHLSLHGEKKYECSVCFKKFHLKASLHEHISQLHGEKNKLKCQYCGKELSGRNSLFSHLLRYHPESKNKSSAPLLYCQMCPKTFHHTSNLHKHQHTHSTSLTYTCSICPLAFRFSEQLKRHLNKHQSGINDWCEKCKRGFKSSSDLHKHSCGSVHLCVHCDKTFKHIQSFKKHMKGMHKQDISNNTQKIIINNTKPNPTKINDKISNDINLCVSNVGKLVKARGFSDSKSFQEEIQSVESPIDYDGNNKISSTATINNSNIKEYNDEENIFLSFSNIASFESNQNSI